MTKPITTLNDVKVILTRYFPEAKIKIKFAHGLWHAKVYDIKGHGAEAVGEKLESTLQAAFAEYEQQYNN